jgi:hypothetical protein
MSSLRQIARDTAGEITPVMYARVIMNLTDKHMAANHIAEPERTYDLKKEGRGKPASHRAQTYFDIYKKVLPQAFTALDKESENQWMELAITADGIVAYAVATNSLNRHNLEADIHRHLLPLFFKHCKAAGAGIDHAKDMVELIIQMTCAGPDETQNVSPT